MSRNLGCSYCKFCGGLPVLEEPARPITAADAWESYAKAYSDLMVARAHCPNCLAKYCAWMSWPFRDVAGVPFNGNPPNGIYDLSFRSTFDDEPGQDDLPTYRVVRRVHLYREPCEQKLDEWYRYVYVTEKEVRTWEKEDTR